MTAVTYNLTVQVSDGLTLGRLRSMFSELADRRIYADFYSMDLDGSVTFRALALDQLWEVRRWARRHADDVRLPPLTSVRFAQDSKEVVS